MSTKGKSYKQRDKNKVREWNRKCRICGQSAYPNYFYCPHCHSRFVGKIKGGEGVTVSVGHWADVIEGVPVNTTKRIY